MDIIYFVSAFIISLSNVIDSMKNSFNYFNNSSNFSMYIQDDDYDNYKDNIIKFQNHEDDYAYGYDYIEDGYVDY